MSAHTTVGLEAIGNLVRTTRDQGGFLVAEFRDANGYPFSEEAKANAQLFVAAGALLEALEGLATHFVGTYANDERSENERYTHLKDFEAKALAAIAKANGSAA